MQNHNTEDVDGASDYQVRLDSSVHRFDAIVSALPDVVLLVDKNGTCMEVFASGKESLLEFPGTTLIGNCASRFLNGHPIEVFKNAVANAIDTGVLQCIEFEVSTEKGRRNVEARMMATGMSDNEIMTAIVVIRDVTERREQEYMTRLVETIFREATEGVMVENADRRVILVNPAMVKLLGVSEASLLGQPSEFFTSMIPEGTLAKIKAALEKRAHWHGEMQIQRSDGTSMLGWVTVDAVLDGDKNVANIVVMLTDISEIKHSRERLQYLATHDSLTGLPNRTLLFDRIRHAIAIMKRNGGMGALFFIDLDRFKEVNDNFGHKAGDDLLQEVAARLLQIIRESDTLGRLGGDEFLLVTEGINDIDEAMVVVQKIRHQFAVPFMIGSSDVEVGASIGIAIFPDDGDEAEQLVNAADRAMYTVKSRGRSGFEFFSRDHSTISREYFFLQRAIRRALRNGGFKVFYQPQFSMVGGKLVGMEALLRCTEPEAKEVPVSQLITIAEESTAIYDIGRYVLSNVCEQVAEWYDHFGLDLSVAVNLSRKELGDLDLIDQVKRILNDAQIDPAMLEFEITESTLMLSSVTAKSNVESLRAFGCRFSIDDFGTGYSSLSNLKEFNLDKLKVDKSFIDDLVTDVNDQIIVQATISMAKKLGLKVLAEGVENQKQFQMLKAFGCDEVQGFLLGKPLHAEEMTALLKRHYRTGGY